jgi:hypothetical protein
VSERLCRSLTAWPSSEVPTLPFISSVRVVATGRDRASSIDDELVRVAAAVRDVLAGDDPAALADLLDPLVSWGDCRGADAVLEFISTAASAGMTANDLTVDVAGDRVIAEFGVGVGQARVAQALFVRDGRICEIVDASDRAHALALRPVGDLASVAQRGWRATSVSPVLPVTDLARAVEHYRAIGFDVRVYEGGAAYAFAARDHVELHLAQVTDLDPSTNTGACYLYVDDADAVYASWRLTHLNGRLTAPVDTDYGLREGAHVDPDGNLVRFGSGR